MSEPLRIPLSLHLQKVFAGLDADEQIIHARRTDAITLLVAAQMDPTTLAGWDVRVVGAEIVCTPPAAPPAKRGARK